MPSRDAHRRRADRMPAQATARIAAAVRCALSKSNPYGAVRRSTVLKAIKSEVEAARAAEVPWKQVAAAISAALVEAGMKGIDEDALRGIAGRMLRGGAATKSHPPAPAVHSSEPAPCRVGGENTVARRSEREPGRLDHMLSHADTRRRIQR